MALSTLDDLLGAVQQDIPISKVSTANTGATNWFAWWRVAGNPSAGTDPSSGVAGQTLTNADAGALPFVNPASGLTYLVRMAASMGAVGVLLLYDRLWHNSGLSPTLTTSQTVNSVALPSRCPVITDPTGQTFDALGHEVEAWFQVMGTAMGAGSVAPTISYTDQSGNAGNTATQQLWGGAMAVNRTSPFSLAAGDSGVRSIQAYQQTATQTSGVFSLVLRRRIATLRLPIANRTGILDWAGLGMPVIPDDAHLELIWLPATTTTISLQADLMLAQG